MPITTPSPLQGAHHGDSDNRLLAKLVNIFAAIIQGDVTLSTSAVADISGLEVTPVKATSIVRAAHTTGLTASQVLVAANSNRAFLLIDNRSGDALYYRYGADAATASPGGYDVRVPSGAMAIEDGWDGAIQFICGGSATTPGVNVSDASL